MFLLYKSLQCASQTIYCRAFEIVIVKLIYSITLFNAPVTKCAIHYIR